MGAAVTQTGTDAAGEPVYDVKRNAAGDEKTAGAEDPKAGDGKPAAAPAVPLNGIQITAALDVLDRYRGGKISALAATSLLSALGIAGESAAAMVASTEVDKPKVVEDQTQVTFKREVVSAFLADKTTADVIYNVTDIPTLLSNVGLPIDPLVAANPGAAVPWLPVLDEANRPVSGEVVTDASGDIVGGAVEKTPEAVDKTQGPEKDTEETAGA